MELHLHLEGAIPLGALWELITKYGGDPSVPDITALAARFTYRDFSHFIDTWVWKNSFLRSYEDFTYIAAAVGQDLARQNIRYVEAFYSPPDFARHGLTPQLLTEAIRRGLDQVPEIEVNLIADLVRDFGPERAGETLEALLEVQTLGVIGVGIGGSEQSYPPELFEHVFERARQSGFHTTAHAGEAAGACSIWGALRVLQVERIGHGTRAGEDSRLLDFLVEEQVPLEMCPLSNVRTGVVPDIASHPIRRYFEHGILITVNTDDPQMFGNSLADEYGLLATELCFSRAQICQLILNGIRASWLPTQRKFQLQDEFMHDPDFTLS